MNNSDMSIDVNWNSVDECRSFAILFANALETPMTVRLDGTLGAGKTQFAKFLAQALGANIDDVTSPTFVLIHRYDSNPMLYHLDAYRVYDEDEFLELGVEELFEEPAITLVEWGGKFVGILPKDHLAIEIEVETEFSRHVKIVSSGPRSQWILSKLRARNL